MDQPASTPQVGGEAVVDGAKSATQTPNANQQSSTEEILHEIKVNGKVKKLSTAELKRLAAISDASQERFTTAKQMKEEAERIRQEMESEDDIRRWKKQGKSNKEMADLMADRLASILEEEQLDPKEREYRSLKAQMEERRKQDELVQKQREENENNTKMQTYMRQLEHEIVEAAESAAVPQTPYLLKQIADQMRLAISQGVDLSAADAAKIVERDWREQVSESLTRLTPAQVREILGDKMVKSLQEQAVAELKTSNAPFTKKAKTESSVNADSKSKTEQQEGPKMSSEEFFRSLRRQRS